MTKEKRNGLNKTAPAAKRNISNTLTGRHVARKEKYLRITIAGIIKTKGSRS